jgi:hypothetical protein
MVRLLVALVLVLVLGGAAAPAEPLLPSPGAGLVLSVRQTPGLMSTSDDHLLPESALYGDGVLLIREARDGVLQRMTRYPLRPARFAALYGEAVRAGLREPRHFDIEGILDGSTVTYRFGTAVTTVYVPGERETGERARLAQLRADLSASATGTPGEPYRPVRLAVLATMDESAPGDRDWPWALSGLCTIVEGPLVAQVSELARTGGPGTVWAAGGHRYHLDVRPLLPGESGCADI